MSSTIFYMHVVNKNREDICRIFFRTGRYLVNYFEKSGNNPRRSGDLVIPWEPQGE